MQRVAHASESTAARPIPQERSRALAHMPGFHLLVESLEAERAPRSAVELPVLEVPPGVSYLAPSRSPLALVARRPRAASLAFEPVSLGAGGGRARLLALNPAGLRARRNGLPLPIVALLDVGDQLQLDARAVLHVTEYRRAGAERPAPELVGRRCGLCRIPLTAATTVFLCSCGVPLHLEGLSVPADRRLECALLGGCPDCERPVRVEGGHVWLPEL